MDFLEMQTANIRLLLQLPDGLYFTGLAGILRQIYQKPVSYKTVPPGAGISKTNNLPQLQNQLAQNVSLYSLFSRTVSAG